MGFYMPCLDYTSVTPFKSGSVVVTVELAVFWGVCVRTHPKIRGFTTAEPLISFISCHKIRFGVKL
jgi:hypothetical protein